MSGSLVAQKPHIVIVNPDQWRGDVLGHMGNPAAVTPNLDQMARSEGVSFRNAFCQNPVCTPSRCSFMSGWYPHVRGHRTMFHMMKPDEPVLLKMLKDQGYYVWWGGKNDLVAAAGGFEAYCHVKHVPQQTRPMYAGDREQEWRGEPEGDAYFSFYAGKLDAGEGEPYYRDSDWAHVFGAIDLIRNAPKDQPICIYLPLMYPHPPYAVEEPWYSLICKELLPSRVQPPEDMSGKPAMTRGLRKALGLGNWSEDRWDRLRSVYYGMCARVDHQFGLLMNALKEAGIYEETAVFFFSDHGDFTGDYDLVEKSQNTFEDCLTRVPLLIKPPAWIPASPRVSDALVELVDFPATVADITGIPLDYSQFGRSLVPLLTGERDEHRDAVFAEGGRLHGEEHCMDITQENQNPSYLYYARAQLHRREGAEHTKATMCRTKQYKYVQRLYESDELYDLTGDPGEQDNRINDPSYAGILAELKERMLRYYQETADVVPWERNQRG